MGREPYGKSLTRALSALCRHFFTDPEQVSAITKKGGAEINAGFNLLMTARPGSMPNVNPANLLADIAPDDGKGIIIHTQQGEIYARNTRKPILAPHHDFPEWSARIFRMGTCPLFTHIMQAQNP